MKIIPSEKNIFILLEMDNINHAEQDPILENLEKCNKVCVGRKRTYKSLKTLEAKKWSWKRFGSEALLMCLKNVMSWLKAKTGHL